MQEFKVFLELKSQVPKCLRKMVLSGNKVNCNVESGININHYVIRDNKNREQFKSPQTYSDSWYVRESTPYGSSSVPRTNKELDRDFWWCWSKPAATFESTMRYSNGTESAANMVASYGVYSDAVADEDDGFVTRGVTGNIYRGVMVNSAGDSRVVCSGPSANAESNSCGWCFSSRVSTIPQPRNSCFATWCRPTILLLILVLLVVVFVLISGILLYYNRTFSSCMILLMFFYQYNYKNVYTRK